MSLLGCEMETPDSPLMVSVKCMYLSWISTFIIIIFFEIRMLVY